MTNERATDEIRTYYGTLGPVDGEQRSRRLAKEAQVAAVLRKMAAPAMRTLVLLPGMEGSALLFRPLIDSAPPDVRIVAVTYPPGDRNSYEDLLPMVLAALPAAGSFYVLGWSFSGPMALMVAERRPPGLRGIALASSFVRRPVPLPRWMRHLARPTLFRLYPKSYQLKALLSGAEVRSLRHLVAEAHRMAGAAALACRARAAMAVAR